MQRERQCNLQLSLRQFHKKTVQKPHRFLPRRRLVVDITRQQHAVRLLPVYDLQDLFQNIPLILQHGKLVDALSQMQVR